MRALKKFSCVHFTANQGYQELVESPRDWKISRKFEKSSRNWSKSRCVKGGLGYFMSLKVRWGYISAQKLESERSKSFAVLFSANQGHQDLV